MTDLAALAAELLPGATAPRLPAPPRPIAWVRVMRARVPAFDGLDPGDLVIVPASALAVVAPGPAEVRELAGSLAAVPISGALLVAADPSADGTDDVLLGLEAALSAAGIPLVRVARTDPAALERSVVGFIVARGAELERQASLLEAELRRRALEGGGATALLGAVSSFLGRALALEGSRGELLGVHAPPEVPRSALDAARYRAGAGPKRDAKRPTGGQSAAAGGTEPAVAMRIDLPSPAGPAGALLVLGSEPPSELVRVTLPRVAGLLALELAREDAIRGAADRARRSEPMPGAGPPWIMVLARQRQPGAEDDPPAAREARDALRRAIRLLAPARRMSLRGDADSLEVRAVAAGTPEERTELAEAIGRLVGPPVALSRPFASPADRPAAEAEARSTLEAAIALEPPPPLAVAERLPIYRMLGALHNIPDGVRLARAVLAPLLDARPDVRRERLETLRALLAHGGVSEAAAALGVHRNTVAYRVRRIEAATGWRLADPDLRLPLAVALGLVQQDQV